MGKRWIYCGLTGAVLLFFGLTVAGGTVKAACGNRIAPGIKLCGTDLSGLTPEEAEARMTELEPKAWLEVVGLLLPELQNEAKERAEELYKKAGQADGEETGGIEIEVRGNKLYLTVKDAMVYIQTEKTMEAVFARSREVKVWEWLYARLFGTPFCVRSVVPVLLWKEQELSEVLELCAEFMEREAAEASVRWAEGEIAVTEGRRGYKINKSATCAEAEKAFSEAMELLTKRWAEGISVRLYISGSVIKPKLTTEAAGGCNTKLVEFATAYSGAGSGRAQNIAAGAEHLHGRVILPGEEFSTVGALSPFTEANGYASGGTYINGALSESIGGGVCQLSTTLYNALLRTGLAVTRRSPHSLPVGYIPLGQDAAIAENYKDLCFLNTTDAPVLLLCEITGETVKVTLYGAEEALREHVSIESVVTEETGEAVTVEVYRTEQTEGGAVVRERISRDIYQYMKKEE